MLEFFDAVRRSHPSAPRGNAPYAAWHGWSCENPELFWPAVWNFSGIIAEERPGRDPWDEVVVGYSRMAPPDATAGPRWFTGARLNFAENLLRTRGSTAAIIFRGEDGQRRELSHDTLAREVARVAGAGRRARVAGGPGGPLPRGGGGRGGRGGGGPAARRAAARAWPPKRIK